MSVIWTLEGEEEEESGSGRRLAVRDVWYGRTVICSRHQLHYQQAQVRL